MGELVDNYDRRKYERTMKRRRQAKRRKINRLIVLVLVCMLIVGLIIAGAIKIIKNKKAKKLRLTAPSLSESVKASELPETTKKEYLTETITENQSATKQNPLNVDKSQMFSIPQGYSQKYCIAVNRATNTVTVYEKGDDGKFTKPVKAMVCSVGLNGGTPVGQFKTYDYFGEKWHLMVDSTYGRYALRITGSIMFHSVTYTVNQDKSSLQYNEYNKLGSAASHGCVRLCLADAKWLTENTSNGTIVKIFDGAPSADPLGKPTPKRIDVNSANRGWDPTDPQRPNS